MERKDKTDYDNVKNRPKSKTINDPRFEQRNHTKKNRTQKNAKFHKDYKNDSTKKSIFNSKGYRNNNPVANIAIIAIVLGIIYFLVIFSKDSFSVFENETNPNIRYVDYKYKDKKSILAVEFVKRYQSAKNNEVKVNLNDVYKKGDTKKDFKVRFGNSWFYQNENGSYLCLLNSYDTKKIYKTDTNHDYKLCGSFYISKTKSPSDYLLSNNQNSDDLQDEETSENYYYINGFFYTEEFCDKVAAWVAASKK